MTDKLITGGAESYFCKLESNLHYDDFKIYTAAGVSAPPVINLSVINSIFIIASSQLH
jgi:hypothetical protein